MKYILSIESLIYNTYCMATTASSNIFTPKPFTFKQGAITPLLGNTYTFTIRAPSYCTCSQEIRMTPEWKKSVKNSCDEGPHYCTDFIVLKPSPINVHNRVRFQVDVVPPLKRVADTEAYRVSWADTSIGIDTFDEVALTVEEVQQISDAVEYLVRR